MLNTDVIETISKFLEGSALIEFMYVNRQTANIIPGVIMRRFPVLTVPIPITLGWAPVPLGYSGDVVYTIGEFVRDADVESRQLVEYVTRILAELPNPDRRHTISFELEVELQIDLAMFDGCRYLKVAGEHLVIPDFKNVERLHIIPGKSVTYTAPIRSPILKISRGTRFVIPDSNITTYTYSPPVHYSQHVDTIQSTWALDMFPNLAPGFVYTSNEPTTSPIDCRAHRANTVDDDFRWFQRLNSLFIRYCTTEILESLNLRDFDQVVVPNVDFRVPAITYNRLESAEIRSRERIDIESLHMVTDLNIALADVLKLPSRNRLTKLSCQPGVDFLDAPNLTELNIFGYQSRQIELAQIAALALTKITRLSLTRLRCSKLSIPAVISDLTLRFITTGDIGTFAKKIVVHGTTSANILTTSGAAVIRFQDSEVNFPIVARHATSLFINMCSDRDQDFVAMKNLKHLDVEPYDIQLTDLPPGLQTLSCKNLNTKTRSDLEITAVRFPELTKVQLRFQWKSIVIKKSLKSLIINATTYPPTITILKDCDFVETANTVDIIGPEVKIGTYRTNNLPGTRCSGSIGHLDINVSGMHDELHYLHALGRIKFATLTIKSGHITRNLSVKNIPEITFIDCTFAPRVFTSDLITTKRIYTNTPELCRNMRVPVYDSATKRRINNLPITE